MTVQQAMSVQGLEDLEDFMRAVSMAGVAHAYAEWTSVSRNPATVANDDLIDYLAEGGRDIRPSDKDGIDATNAYATEVLKQIDNNTKRAFFNEKHAAAIASGTKKARTVKELDVIVKSGITNGLRKGITLLAERMAERAANQKNTDGSQMDKVSKEYADKRKKDHGIDPGVVYTATGQLGDALLERRFRIHLDKKPNIVQRIRLRSAAKGRGERTKNALRSKTTRRRKK
jgi:hypothetical protein